MKSFLTIFTLVFSVTFSSTSFAEWAKVTTNANGSTYYVDFERIRKHSGYVYWWDLVDYLKPKRNGVWSSQTYYEGDCGKFRLRILGDVFHKQPMGRDTGTSSTRKNPEWSYASPRSIDETILKSVCSR
jgi:hypothetical protein